ADPVDLSVRSFSLRGCVLEEDIISGAADALRVIFVGLFGRFPQAAEQRSFRLLISNEFTRAMEQRLPALAQFMKTFPHAGADVSMQYMAAMRKAAEATTAVNHSRPAAELVRDLIHIHLENTAIAAASSYMRFLLNRRPQASTNALLHQTRLF